MPADDRADYADARDRAALGWLRGLSCATFAPDSEAASIGRDA